MGRYEVLSEIGRGGTATVHLARQIGLGRLVALKELTATSGSDASAARRFVRESRLAGSLNHPNIVTVHDFFEHRATPYIAMEYLERGSLRPVMRELTLTEVAGVLEGLLAGLRHAQARGIVHRDIKPENLLLAEDGRVKIADFGIAKATGELRGSTLLTSEGTTIGTPTYMAPEQAMARDIGPWTDLYAVGVIAFELLAGRPPFDTTGSPMTVLLRHVNEPPLVLSSVDPSADPRLSDWIGRLLVKDPADRTQTAAEALEALEEIVSGRLSPHRRRTARVPAGATPPTASLVSPAAAGQAAVTPPTASLVSRAATGRRPAPRRAPRRRAAVPGAGRSATRLARALVLVIGLAGALIALAMAGGGGGRSPAPASVSPAPAATSSPVSATARGVGDSKSDDPSDDEPDGPEP